MVQRLARNRNEGDGRTLLCSAKAHVDFHEIVCLGTAQTLREYRDEIRPDDASNCSGLELASPKSVTSVRVAIVTRPERTGSRISK
jgi:hypothetical protein